ncbi:BON domain-containing protein [Allokutzneria sp. A3M-2-11 16]|uniref:BON domain-containing protein n=1 Tax=Allokutzneria sp. A3M-2-11 16 TaxID=2962043 RepID=UPI0020B87B35|nr:BON domain-containing protein [Allokutzneria sp. A3M-2-11 16]MCP3801591.1 BON domain-containing protein [Allokutzneria sp. A3M-2-11 16]
MTTDQEPPQYAVARLRRALAEDPRTAEQGVRVDLRGEQVYLSGDVASEERKRTLDQVVHDIAANLKVHNDVRVVEAKAPVGQEELR